MVQATDYPWSGKVAITVNPKASKTFSVRLRVPDRAVSDLYKATPEAEWHHVAGVNGTAVKAKMENGYAVITRAWKEGDKIDLVLPMRRSSVHGSEKKLEATRNKVALRYGRCCTTSRRWIRTSHRRCLDSPLTTEGAATCWAA